MAEIDVKKLSDEQIEDYATRFAEKLYQGGDVVEELICYIGLAWGNDPDLMRDDIRTLKESEED